MSYYKRNVGSNRDALFGASSAAKNNVDTAKKKAKNKLSSLKASSSNNMSKNSSSSVGATAGSSRIDTSRLVSNKTGLRGTTTTTATTAGSSSSSRKGVMSRNVLTGSAKLEVMKEAEECRLKAKKCMTRGVFSGIDPVSAGMWYHKAAELYKKCGDEDRLERLHRIASGDCNRGTGAWSTAANEYSRAAELAAISPETLKRRQTESHKLYRDAAEAYLELGDMKKRGESLLQAALGLLLTDDDNNNNNDVKNNKLQSMPKQALQELEEAVEAHVPDPLNPNRTHRQTKASIFNPQVEGEEVNLDLCQQHVVNKSYAFETLYKIVYACLDYNEYPSAIYAAGAATYLLEIDPHSTISLARAYVTETILTLAMGDVVAAEQAFLNKHLQNNYYLQSRECKLAEDLIRAIQTRNAQELHDARTTGNKSAMSNLNISIRNLTHKLQLTGIAKDEPLHIPPPKPTTTTKNNNPTSYMDNTTPADNLDGHELQASLDANFDEMEDLMNFMGLGENDEQSPPPTTTTISTKSSSQPTSPPPPPPPKPQQYHNTHHDDDDDDLDIDLR